MMDPKAFFADLLRGRINKIKEDLARFGPVPKGNPPGEWKVTIVLRHTGVDTCMLYGQDDEAALIVALTQLGTGTGRRSYRSGPGTFTEEE